MFRSKFLMAAFVAAIAALAGPATSQAGFTIEISDNHGNTTGILTPPGTFFSGNFALGNYSINFTANSTSPGTPSQSFLSSGTISVTALSHDLGTTLHFTVISNGFTNGFPGATAFYTSSIAATLLNGSGTGFSTINGTQFSSTLGITGVGSNSESGGVVLPSNPYSLGTDMTLVLGDTASGNQAATATFTTQLGDNNGHLLFTPAPAGLILAATGVPFLGLLRRRMRRTETTVAA